jgi:hypothetical protein
MFCFGGSTSQLLTLFNILLNPDRLILFEFTVLIEIFFSDRLMLKMCRAVMPTNLFLSIVMSRLEFYGG